MNVQKITFNPIARAIAIFGAVAVLVTGVTYAALTSSATLTGNTITSANSSLLIYDGTTFASTANGFDVTGLIPGQGSDENFVYLKNAGDTDLKVTVSSDTPVAPPAGYGFTGWENLKVTIKDYDPTCVGNATVNTTMQELMAPGGVVLPCSGALSEGAQGDNSVLDTEGNYSFTFDIAPESVTPGGSPGVGDFNLTFNGTAVATPVEVPVGD
jgi:predicted ribosomally synthesized peptide with SipW-like signal peptide